MNFLGLLVDLFIGLIVTETMMVLYFIMSSKDLLLQVSAGGIDIDLYITVGMSHLTDQ